MTHYTIQGVKDAMICKLTKKALLSIIPAVFIMIFRTTGVFADAMPPHINMNSYNERYEPGVIKAEIIDDTQVGKVTLYYRQPGEYSYNSIDMKKNDQLYYRELRRELGVHGMVEYYILAQDTSGNETTEPRMDPETNPLAAAMDEMVSYSADEVVLSSPEPGTLVVTGNQMIIVSFYKTDREVDMNTVRIRIDDRDRTREADIVGNIVMWEPRRPLQDGVHLVEVYARDTTGNMVGPNMWSFRVKTKLELPMGMSGNFYMGLQHDDRSVDSDNVPLWNNKLDLSLQGEKDWVTWEAGVLLSSEESSFLTSEDLADTQPINRYYLNALTRHWRLRVGDSNPNFSELSLNGILVRGLNAQFKSNRFNAQVVYGYNKRNIDESVTVLDNVTIIDADRYITADNDTIDTSEMLYEEIVNGQVQIFTPGTFQRNVTALKMDTTPVKSRYATWNIGLNFSAPKTIRPSSMMFMTVKHTVGITIMRDKHSFQPVMHPKRTGWVPLKVPYGSTITARC